MAEINIRSGATTPETTRGGFFSLAPASRWKPDDNRVFLVTCAPVGEPVKQQTGHSAPGFVRADCNVSGLSRAGEPFLTWA